MRLLDRPCDRQAKLGEAIADPLVSLTPPGGVRPLHASGYLRRHPGRPGGGYSDSSPHTSTGRGTPFNSCSPRLEKVRLDSARRSRVTPRSEERRVGKEARRQK